MLAFFRSIHFPGFLAFMICFGSCAHADTAAIRSADNAVWIADGSTFLNYKETVSPIPDSEHGWLSNPSVAGGVSFLTNGNLYFDLDGSYAYGHTRYNGAYFNAPNVPLQASTKDTLSDLDAKFGRAFAFRNNFLFTPYLDFGLRYWDRNLGPGTGTEHYQNFDLAGGLMAQFSPLDRLILTGYAAYGSTFGAQVKAESNATTYDLGSSGILKLGGKIGFDVAPRVELFTALDFDRFHFAQSPVAADGTYEPGSKTSDTAARIGIAYHFR